MNRYKIVYVEDNRIDFEMVKAVLEDQGLVDVMYRVETKEEFVYTLKHEEIDVILTDFSLPLFHGLEAVEYAAVQFPYTPVIVVTGNKSDEIAVDIVKKGAWDYVLKENISRLAPAIHAAFDKRLIKIEKDEAIKTLRESETNYRLLAESSPFGIIVHSEGIVLYHNRQASRLIGASEDFNLTGLRFADYIHSTNKDLLDKRLHKLYKGEQIPGVQELKFVDRKGRDLIMEVASSPISFQGKPAGQVIFNDIAERKKHEKELLEAKEKAEQSDRLKTAFLENLSHEIRTPLNGIIGFASLLKLSNVSEQDKLSYIGVIEESSKHLLTIIDDLIEISRIETGQFELRKEVFNLNSLLEEIYIFFNDGEKYKNQPVLLNLSSHYASKEAIFYGDKARLRQIFFNLLQNAYKFTDQGRIDFGYEVLADKSLRFYVKDTGTGIPEKSQDSVFERFIKGQNSSERNSGGNGLGLTICKGIINAMGGKIWFDSEEDRGTEFYFQLRLEKAMDESQEKEYMDVSDRDYKWEGKVILIAEDEITNFKLLKEILEDTGAEILHAKTGREVLRIMSRKQQVDLILLDIKMPEMNGIDVVKSLRSNAVTLPVIAQTAFAMTEDETKCIEAGCNDYITKPIRIKELLEKIHRQFHVGQNIPLKNTIT